MQLAFCSSFAQESTGRTQDNRGASRATRGFAARVRDTPPNIVLAQFFAFFPRILEQKKDCSYCILFPFPCIQLETTAWPVPPSFRKQFIQFSRSFYQTGLPESECSQLSEIFPVAFLSSLRCTFRVFPAEVRKHLLSHNLATLN